MKSRLTLDKVYRGRLYPAQNTTKHYPGRAGQNSLATAGTNFTKPGAQHKVDLCMSELPLLPGFLAGVIFFSHGF